MHDKVLKLQAEKIRSLIEENEKLGARAVQAESLIHAICCSLNKKPDEVLVELEGLKRWRHIGATKLAPTVEQAEMQIDILWSYVKAMGSPGHRAVSFIGKRLGGFFLFRWLKNAAYALMALRQA
jgi:hypothetical protein